MHICQSVLGNSYEEGLVLVEGAPCDLSVVTIMVLHTHALLKVEVNHKLNFSIVITNVNDVSITFLGQGHVSNMNARFNWDGLQRSFGINRADVDETIELALGSNDELIEAVTGFERHDCSNGLWLPNFLRLILFWRKLTSESHSSLLFFLSFIFLLILDHLELHDLDVPLLDVGILP